MYASCSKIVSQEMVQKAYPRVELCSILHALLFFSSFACACANVASASSHSKGGAPTCGSDRRYIIYQENNRLGLLSTITAAGVK